jgi:hypothetical protein
MAKKSRGSSVANNNGLSPLFSGRYIPNTVLVVEVAVQQLAHLPVGHGSDDNSFFTRQPTSNTTLYISFSFMACVCVHLSYEFLLLCFTHFPQKRKVDFPFRLSSLKRT